MYTVLLQYDGRDMAAAISLGKFENAAIYKNKNI